VAAFGAAVGGGAEVVAAVLAEVAAVETSEAAPAAEGDRGLNRQRQAEEQLQRPEGHYKTGGWHPTRAGTLDAKAEEEIGTGWAEATICALVPMEARR
jgi:hypothetical protein